MLLDIRKYILRGEVDIVEELVIDLSAEDFSSDIKVNDAVKFKYHLKKQDYEGLSLQTKIAFTANAFCGRCLKDFSRDYEFEADYVIRDDDYQCEFPELPIRNDGKLDLNEFCYTEIVLGLPGVILCDELCQGLCSVCGKPREEECGCCQNVGDDKLSIFNELLS